MKCHEKLIVFILVLVFMTAGCATTKMCKPCPPEDAYFLVGPGIPVHVPKGFFDNSKDWATKEEMRKIIEEMRAKERGI